MGERVPTLANVVLLASARVAVTSATGWRFRALAVEYQEARPLDVAFPRQPALDARSYARGPGLPPPFEGRCQMLFYVAWKARAGQGPVEAEAGLAAFARWKAPVGMEFKGFYARADGGGFCLCEAGSAEVMFEVTAPWAGVYLDYDIVPIVEIEKGVELLNKAIAFRKG